MYTCTDGARSIGRSAGRAGEEEGAYGGNYVFSVIYTRLGVPRAAREPSTFERVQNKVTIPVLEGRSARLMQPLSLSLYGSARTRAAHER